MQIPRTLARPRATVFLHLIAALIPLTLIAQPTIATPAAHDGSLLDPDMRYIGRWDKSQPDVYHSYWDSAYLRTRFTGASVAIKLAAGTGLSVSIDGEAVRDVNANAGLTVLNSQPLTPGTHSLLVGSQGQNFELAFQGLALEPGATTLSCPARPLIEFVGDSISTGKGYCWLTGEALGCDHVQIAFSGIALTSGYGCLPDHTGQNVQYFRLKNFNHLQDNPPVPWNFAYTPQIIVINLGQNDQCGSEKDETMTASYLSFARKLRAQFPLAHIVALRPFGGPYAEAERKAIETLVAGGDKRAHYIDTTGWLDKPDFRDGIHPNAYGHIKVTRQLAPLLKPWLADATTATL